DLAAVPLDDEDRHLSQRRKLEKPVRLVREIDVDPLERNALLVQRDHRALHIGAKLVADQFHARGHGVSSTCYMHLHVKIHAYAYNRQGGCTCIEFTAARSPRRSWA